MWHETDEEKLHEGNIKKYGADVSEDEIRRLYQSVLAYYETATQRKFVPVLVFREVKEILSERVKTKTFP
ncbi:hypothetical protein A2W60_01745 [Candidatus Azambacteria bacterium RIFCSPHIGHO2_02_46_12]|uniref:HD domain-containing protein n=1 Tax=Candidatus Azambacteria bacterium RIFCSPHIGHO2_02_46_12 TaxID=1797295 RepID=A0A1F5BJE4_9BACT|nr:MAG: hypothetical protein A2W60_01745 [Candidatus Azambacteria bacterium RIFCSPHIGHO2_02_46_12]